MKGLTHVLAFIGGAAVGGCGMWLVLKKYYEKKSQDEIAEARATFHEMMKAKDTPAPMVEIEEFEGETAAEPEKPTITNYGGVYNPSHEELRQDRVSYFDLLSRLHYGTNMQVLDTYIRDTIRDPAHLIPPDEFGQKEDHTPISLMWFMNGSVLVDPTNGTIFDEHDQLLGPEAQRKLSDPTTGNCDLYVRNDALKLDIEVVVELDQAYDEHDWNVGEVK